MVTTVLAARLVSLLLAAVSLVLFLVTPLREGLFEGMRDAQVLVQRDGWMLWASLWVL